MVKCQCRSGSSLPRHWRGRAVHLIVRLGPWWLKSLRQSLRRGLRRRNRRRPECRGVDEILRRRRRHVVTSKSSAKIHRSQ